MDLAAHRKLKQPAVLPISRQEMQRLGWQELDILFISGDAYVDHPSFGVALLGRWLVHHGYRVGIVAQPRWTSPDDVARLGRPRLFAGITAGALDSMLAHYTAFRKLRHDDAYTPGGRHGARPNRACLVYTSLVKQAFPGLPIVLGGIEASLRRITHYDFWSDKLRRSLLVDAKADLLLYGMAEKGVVAAARRLEAGLPPADPSLPSAVYIGDPAALPGERIVELPTHEAMLEEPTKLIEATQLIEQQVHHASHFAVQRFEKRALILTPPHQLGTAEMDALYALPFTRDPHPAYRNQQIPAAEMIRFSQTSHRGCGGGCSFCSLALHQGRTIRSRSRQSLLDEAKLLTQHTGFRGSISDVGGPSANMWGAVCADDPSRCQRASCLFPSICPHFVVDQMKIVEVLRQIKAVPGVKHVRVASGIRHDLALKDRNYIRALVREFVGGQLKIAPEHLSDHVLRLMRKPGERVFEQFLDVFADECRAAGKEQFIVPYLLTAFPGCTEPDMARVARWMEERGWQPQQVQCFIPLPGTMSAAMYFSGREPGGKAIPVARTDAERLRQHHQLFCEPGRRPPPSHRGKLGRNAGATKPFPRPETRRPARDE